MRIVHAMLAPRRGGIECAFVRWAEALLRLGHEVICVVTPGAEIVHDLPGGVEVRTLPQRSERDPRAWWHAWKMLRTLRPALIVTHGNRAGRLLRVAHRGTVPHLAVLHRPRFKGLARYDAVACVSRELMQQAVAAGLPFSRLQHIPNFLPEHVQALPPRVGFQRPPVIGVLGRFVPEKGVDLFIEALAMIPQARALIGGDGPERVALEEQIARLGLGQRVEMAGWVSDVDAFYRQIDVLCVPSRHESFGLIILEAWARGVPVVATRTSGPSELITDGWNGLLCAPQPALLAERLSSLLQQPDEALRMATQAQYALASYRMEAVLPFIQALCSRVSARQEAA
jgi:glycosyltransferase involved in cell wall biosynthesis